MSNSTSSHFAIPEKYALPELPHVEGTEPSASILDSFRIAAAQVVSDAVGIDLEKAFGGVEISKKQADLHVAMPRFRLGGKPDTWAQKVVEHFKPSPYLSACTSLNGFVSFTFNQDCFSYHVLRQIRMCSSSSSASGSSVKPGMEEAKVRGYGTNTSGKGKTVVLDFSAPNIAKPFHVGHLRSTIIGAFLANLHEACGWKAVRWNYLGDWGKQFGLLAVGFQMYGNEKELEENAVQHLFEIYVRINAAAKEDPAIHDQARAFFKKMEDGDAESLALWRRFKDMSIKRFEPTYARMNIHFDTYNGESAVKPESMEKAVELLEKANLLETDPNGAILVNLEPYKLGKTIIRKADGTSIYITRDLGGAAERYEKHKFDKMIYVVASQQDFHNKQLFKMLELMGYEWAKDLIHINFGMVLGMSTRKGTVKFLDDILLEAKEAMHDQMSKNEEKYALVEDPDYTSDVIGQTAVKIQDMSAARIKDYKFDPVRMTAFDGDTGAYIQYSHVRLCSVERKNPNVILPENIADIHIELLTEPKVKEIIYLLGVYPQVVRNALQVHEASTIVSWLFLLTHAVSSAWENVKVSGSEEQLAIARLYLFICTRDVLASAMRLLTLTPLDRM